MSQPAPRLCLFRQELLSLDPPGLAALPDALMCTRDEHPGDDRHFDARRLTAWLAEGESVRVATVLPGDFSETAALAQLGRAGERAILGGSSLRHSFRARLHGEPTGGHQRVQVFGGPAGGTRGLLGVLVCRPDEAADLITLLGEAEP